MTHFKLLLILGLIAVNQGHPVDFGDDEVPAVYDIIEKFDDVALADYRLNDDVMPENYKVTLTPYFDEGGDKDFTFDGEVTIRFRATRNCREITMHGNKITIDSWTLLDADLGGIPKGEMSHVEELHKYTFPIGEGREFIQGTVYNINIKYRGILDDSMNGFYRSTYMEKSSKKWLGTTQFQMTEARRAFPCFDEPKFKATFDIAINRREDYEVTIGNTKVKTTGTPTAGRVLETFETTPVMSSYLIAFVIQQYDKRQTTDLHYGVFARPEAHNQTKYAFEVGEQLLDKMGEWVDYPFDRVPQIQKLDMIAVPDFSAGAMENWGAMTYRESSLLWDERESQAINKQRIAAVLTHEIAHLWFGDLVTCDWWSVTWLNEGFARFFQYFGTDLVEDKWDLEEQFVAEQLQGVFQMDSTTSTYPMTNPHVYTPSQVSAMFGSISYNKGATILRWIQHYMGAANFQQAVKDYIKANEYKTVVPQNLFTAFERQAPGINIANVFIPWTEQVGYPVVTVESFSNNRIKLTQKRFMLNPAESDTSRWSIPLTYAVNAEDFGKTATQMMFPRDQAEYTRTIPDGDLGFYMLNVQQVGYYRVNYDEGNWHKIHAALLKDDFGKIPTLNRAQVVDDLFNLAQAGEIKYSLTLDIIDYLKSEKKYTPWLAAFNGLAYISRRIADNDELGNFEGYIKYLIADAYEHFGFHPKAGDTHTEILNRVNILNWACKHKHEDCIEKSKTEYAKLWTESETNFVDPNIRVPVYCTGVREGNQDAFNKLWERYLVSNVGHEQNTILQALGCTKDKDLLWRYLDYIIADPIVIRAQDRSTCFNNAFSGNHENVDHTLDYLIDRYQRWQPVMGSVANSISTLSSRFTREEQAAKVEKFAQDAQDLTDAQRTTLRSVAARTRANIAWDNERLPEVSNWMARKRSNGAGSISATFGLLFVTLVGYFYLI